MSKLILAVALVFALAIPASAVEFTAPQVPEKGAELMPEDTGSFAAGLTELLRDAVLGLRPDLKEASKVSLGVIAAVMMVSLLQSFSGNVKTVANLVGATAIAAGLLLSANSLIRLGSQTVTEISEYGKLLLPVMTAAMAAQGGAASSTALYAGTAVFDSVLSSLISRILGPMVYLFLALSAANGAIGENILGKLRDLVKNVVSWSLKTILTVFTTYMTVTGVVSGTTDAAALKATKVTISSVVPVVGGILSDASEAVLVSAGLMKNAAGIYGILAVLAVFLSPFLKIGPLSDTETDSRRMRHLRRKGTDGADRGFFHSYGTAACHDRIGVSAAAHQHGVFSERSGIMEALRQYVISVVAATMLCGIVVRLFPNGSGKQMGKLICGLFLAYTVLSPISRVDFSKLPDFSLRCMDDAEDAAAMGENLARDSMADIIKEETEAYILDKAADLHANLRVAVTIGEDNLPAAVTISGEASPYARRQIQAMIANDLGISKENQKWIG